MNAQKNSSFLPDTPLQFAFDNTSLNALKTCPRLYQYTILEGWAPKVQSIHLTFGLIYHEALEHYDHLRFDGASHDDALLGAIDCAMKATWTNGRPWSSDDPNKNRWTLIRTIGWYLDQFKEDPLETIKLANGKPAVELSFRLETEYRTASGQPFLYCGHIDRIARLNGQDFVLDRKTTKHTLDSKFFDGFSPFAQFSGYLFAARVLFADNPGGVIVDGAQVAATFSRFGRQTIPISEFQLDEWYKSLGYWLKLAEGYAAANFWPLNEASCGNYGGCPFRPICSKGTPKAREEWLKAGYVKRVWDPLAVRGDI